MGVSAALLLTDQRRVLAAAKPARIVAIALEPSDVKVSLLPGDEQAIRAIATYSDKSTQDVTERLVYASSKPDVVAVVGQGLARAIRSGDAEISASDPVSGKSARTSVKFKVAKLKRIDLLPEGKVVPVGRTLALRAIGTYDNGRTGIDLTQRVVWSSDKSRVATVGAAHDGSVIVTGIAAGQTKIVALEPLDRVKSDSNSGKVTIVAKLSSVAVDPAAVALRNGQTAALTAYGLYEGGAIADLTPYVEWSSSNPAVAVVDAAGLLAARGVGSARVGAFDPVTGIGPSRAQDEARIDVLGALIGLVAAPASRTLSVGGSVQMTALAAFEGRDDSVQLRSGVSWKSSNSASLTIDAATGAARCVAAGASIVSFFDAATAASSSTFGGDARIACVADVPTVRLTPVKKLLAVGKTVKLAAFVLMPDGTERDITSSATWTSSRPDLVSVGPVTDTMRARAHAPGVAFITAVDPVTGASSAGPGGIGAKLSVPGPPKVLKIFPAATSSAGIELTTATPFLLKARVDFEGGANQGANNLVLWTSSDPSVLKVSNGEDGKQPGLATPLRPGDATVSIQYPKPGAPPPQFPPLQPMSKSVKVRVR